MTVKIEKNIRFSSEISTLKKENPMFSKARIRVAYSGFNRNGSYISRQVIESALKTIYNIPIVGEYLEQDDNFGDHGVSIEFKGDEVKFIQNTRPYGVVPESAKVYWEQVEEKNGAVNEYLVVDGAYLWTGRYEELNSLIENEHGQSMEIEIVNGSPAIVDGVETFKIEEFIFSAFCILGIDKDGAGHVEPAFESASISAYSLNKESFKKEFNQMISELKFSLEQGGKSMTVEKVEQEEVKEEVFEVEAIVEEVDTHTADITEENKPAEEKDAETFEQVENSTEEVVDEELSDESKGTDEEDVTNYKQKYMELLLNFDDINTELSSLKEELNELKTYKRERQELDLKSKFEGRLSEDEINQVFNIHKEDSLDIVEEKLFAMIGKKNYSLQKQTKESTNKVVISQNKNEDSNNPYGTFFED